MLIAQLKPIDDILSAASGKTFSINCVGCREVYFPENEAINAQKVLLSRGPVIGSMTADYICNPHGLELQLRKHLGGIDSAETILVFSCGVGVQTVADMFPGAKVTAACDTYPLPGAQGVTPLEYDCGQCGDCRLNETGGICPITSCSKSLLNGQCGGAKNGRCEVDDEMECGWERIYKRLEKLGLPGAPARGIDIRDWRDGRV